MSNEDAIAGGIVGGIAGAVLGGKVGYEAGRTSGYNEGFQDGWSEGATTKEKKLSPIIQDLRNQLENAKKDNRKPPIRQLVARVLH